MQNYLSRIRQKLYPDTRSLLPVVADWKQQGERIVFTNGCFDILHPGHIDYLAKAAGLGTKFIIGMNTDVSVSALKGPHRPIQNDAARAMLLAALSFTHAIVPFGEPTPQLLIEAIAPDILVKGADYRPEEVAGAAFVMAYGGSLVLLPYLPGHSTSAIEARIRAAK